jgi:hypothetical protein
VTAAPSKPPTDAGEVKREIERSWVRQTRDSQEIAKIIRNQLRAVARFQGLEYDLRLGLALSILASSILIAAGALWLGWRQRRSLAALESRILGRLEELQQAVQSTVLGGVAAAKESPKTQGAGVPPPRKEPQTLGGNIALPLPDAPADPRRDAGEELPSIPSGMRHSEIARLLAKLRQDGRQLAERFADPELRERFRGELDAPVGARLERLKLISEQGDEQLRQRWLGPDLVTTLDALARFYSEAVEEERHGPGNGLARELRVWLYDSFGPACRTEGWFAIDPIDPYVTKFDPRVHHAVAGRDVDGAEGRIIAIKAIGRRDPRSGAVSHKAEVIVGR